MNKVLFEKIIEKLEEAKSNVPVNRLLDDKPKELGQLMAYNKAIEIVNQFGISDDVCEWKKDNMFETLYRVCDGFYTNVYRNDFEYCPYCGKKIKVVE